MISPTHKASAFSLIEVTLALGVAAFCLLAISGLLTVGVKTNKKSTSQNVATNILAAAVSDLRASPKVALGQSPGGSSPLFGISLSGTTRVFFDTSGSKTDVPAAQAYRLTVTASNSGASTPTYASLQVSWPAAVDPATGSPDGSTETFAAVDLHY